MLFPQNMLIGSIISIIYCYTFWKWDSLGPIKEKAFNFAVTAQAAFWIFYFGIVFYIRSNQQNIGINILYNGVFLFYFILYLPFFSLIFYTLYKKIKPLEDYPKIIRYIVLVIIFLILMAIFILGLYVFILFFYGFAP